MHYPQYGRLVLIIPGLTLLMFPVLVFMYARLARLEEREVREHFGEAYLRYATQIPAFIPQFRAPKGHHP